MNILTWNTAGRNKKIKEQPTDRPHWVSIEISNRIADFSSKWRVKFIYL